MARFVQPRGLKTRCLEAGNAASFSADRRGCTTSSPPLRNSLRNGSVYQPSTVQKILGRYTGR
jgi:hypothetical protein